MGASSDASGPLLSEQLLEGPGRAVNAHDRVRTTQSRVEGITEAVAKRRLEVTTSSSNMKVGLYGAEVNPLLRRSELETFHAEFIPDISVRAKD